MWIVTGFFVVRREDERIYVFMYVVLYEYVGISGFGCFVFW